MEDDYKTPLERCRDEIHSLDCSLHDRLGEIVCTDISCDSDRLSTPCFDLLHDCTSLLCVDTSVLQVNDDRAMHSDATGTHSLTTTLAPSLANSNAALLPMPYFTERDVI
jgi:hypothetical protein